MTENILAKNIDQRTVTLLGPVQRPPSRPNPWMEPVPSSTQLSQNAPKSDVTLASEETVTFDVILVPNADSRDGGYRADQLIKTGDVLFCSRSMSSEQTYSGWELSHLNIFLSDRYLKFLELKQTRVQILVQDMVDFDGVRSGNLAYNKDSAKRWGELTFGQLLELANYYPEYDTLASGYTSLTALPSSFKTHLITALPLHFPEKKKSQYQLNNEPESLSENLRIGLQQLFSENKEMSDDEVPLFNALRNKLNSQKRARELVDQIWSHYYEITRYLSVEGIRSIFSYLGVVTSSQEDTDLQAIKRRGNPRQLLVANRGPNVEVYNVWGNQLPQGVCLWFILKRILQSDGTFGPFQYVPYWGVRQSKATRFGVSTIIGPVNDLPSRFKIVPPCESNYIDLSGKEAFGHLIYVGRVQYEHEESLVSKSKAIAAGAQEIPPDERSLSNPLTVQAAYSERSKLNKLSTFLNV